MRSIFFCLALGACQGPRAVDASSSDVTDRAIVGGHQAEDDQFPHQVQLHSDALGAHCGGSILNDEWVLTAAHCVIGVPGSMFVESRSIESGAGISTEVLERVIHDDYGYAPHHADIALLRVAGGLSGVDEAVRLPPATPTPGTVTTVSGWGATSENGSGTRTLRYTEVPVIDHETCAQALQSADVDETMLCAGLPDGGRDSCQGDSGGPLVVPYDNGSFGYDGWMQVGIVSWGEGCARPGSPGVYTDVAHFRDWIEAHITSWDFPTLAGGDLIEGHYENELTHPYQFTLDTVSTVTVQTVSDLELTAWMEHSTGHTAALLTSVNGTEGDLDESVVLPPGTYRVDLNTRSGRDGDYLLAIDIQTGSTGSDLTTGQTETLEHPTPGAWETLTVDVIDERPVFVELTSQTPLSVGTGRNGTSLDPGLYGEDQTLAFFQIGRHRISIYNDTDDVFDYEVSVRY